MATLRAVLSLSALVRRFARKVEGIAATEFALIAPMLLLLLCGGSELALFVRTHFQAAQMASTVADVVASLCNVLGAVINWALGRGVERFRDKCWFPVSPAVLDRATGWYRRWGRWSLLLSSVSLAGVRHSTLLRGSVRHDGLLKSHS